MPRTRVNPVTGAVVVLSYAGIAAVPSIPQTGFA